VYKRPEEIAYALVKWFHMFKGAKDAASGEFLFQSTMKKVFEQQVALAQKGRFSGKPILCCPLSAVSYHGT